VRGNVELGRLGARDLFDLGMQRYQKKKYWELLKHSRRRYSIFPAKVTWIPRNTISPCLISATGTMFWPDRIQPFAGQLPGVGVRPQAQLMKRFRSSRVHRNTSDSIKPTCTPRSNNSRISSSTTRIGGGSRGQAYLKEARIRLARKLYESGTIYTRLRDYYASRCTSKK